MSTEPVPASLASYKPSSIESEASRYLFSLADTDGLGVLTGEQAVPFLTHAKLAPALLGTVWQICDSDNTGFLTPFRFGAACRLIGHAQAAGGTTGDAIPLEYVGLAGPLPKFDGFPLPAHLASAGTAPSTPQMAARTTASSSPSARRTLLATNQEGTNIAAEDKARYDSLFNSSGPKDGLLAGEAAQVIFVKSKLPFETLGQIWNLADTRSRGALDVTDFTIAMHFIQHTMNNPAAPLPSVLSPALYASALSLPPPATGNSVRSGIPPTTPMRQSTMTYAPVMTLSPQMTGQSSISLQQQQQQQQYQPSSSSTFSSPAKQFNSMPSQNAPNVPWDVSPKEKADADMYFAGLDPTNKGVIEGEMAMPFMMASRLPIEVLALVWELADIRGQGALNRDEFAVAMRLIVDKQAGKDLPAVLPLSMIPPSLRPQEAQQDLLLLDDEDDLPLASLPNVAPTRSMTAMSPQPTGTSVFSNAGLQGTIFPQATGGSHSLLAAVSQAPVYAQSTLPPLAPTSSSFLDEIDHAERRSLLATSTVALDSLRAEHASTTSSLSHLSAQRETLEASLTSTTSSLNDLHAALTISRTAHEAERALVDSLIERQSTQSALLSRARSELISAESDLSALRVSRAEIEGSFLRDKEEIRALKTRLGEVEKETIASKDELEAAKKESRRVKGLVAITKKQVAAAESEHESVQEELKKEKDDLTMAAAVDDSQASPFDHSSASSPASAPASSSVLPESSAAVTHSIPPPTRSTNPFDRMGSFASPSSAHVAPESTPAASTSTSPSMLTALPIAIVGGATALFGAAATKVFGSEEASNEPGSTEQTAVVADKDPFGMYVVRTSAAASGEESKGASFDDTFGDDFGSQAVAGPSTSTSKPIEVEDLKHSSTSQRESKVSEEEEEEDSSDDDEPEAIEEATAAASRHQFGATTTNEGPKSSSDSSSFVHVSAGSAIDDNEAEKKFPALDEDDNGGLPLTQPLPNHQQSQQVERTLSDGALPLGTGHLTPLTSPSSEMDTFEDATTGMDERESTYGGSNVEEGSSSFSAVAGGSSLSSSTTTTKKRAAPPPPPSRSSLPFSASTFNSIPFVATSTSVATASNAADDFDKAFQDFSATPADSFPRAAATTTTTNDFDNFDDEFASFAPATATLSSIAAASDVVMRKETLAASNDFDDFDSAFDPPPAAAPASFAITGQPSPPPTFDAAVASSSAAAQLPPAIPHRPAAPPPTIAQSDDVKGIKDIVAMGFTRAQAIDALEKHNYDVSEAIDSLLG